jgi:uracil-DNA glycosylase
MNAHAGAQSARIGSASPRTPLAQTLSGPMHAHLDAMPSEWCDQCTAFLTSGQSGALCRFIDDRLAAGAVVYPAEPLAALRHSPPSDVRVVIVGQDPYHGPGQAHGFAFSVPPSAKAPPSLRNILGEVARDRGCSRSVSPCLLRWARQGVLLLNSVLTVEQGQPGGHARRGWESLTDCILDAMARSGPPKAFLLWGAQAQAHRGLVERAKRGHLILTANHPSPLSARRGPEPFVGCGHFSKVNAFLTSLGLPPIDWCADL